MSFSTFNFSAQIQGALRAQGFETPTPIQAQAIPLVMNRKDLIGLAQTGTGKTAAQLFSARADHSAHARAGPADS